MQKYTNETKPNETKGNETKPNNHTPAPNSLICCSLFSAPFNLSLPCISCVTDMLPVAREREKGRGTERREESIVTVRVMVKVTGKVKEEGGARGGREEERGGSGEEVEE